MDVVNKYSEINADKIMFSKSARTNNKTGIKFIPCRYNRQVFYLQTPRMNVKNVVQRIGDHHVIDFELQSSSDNNEQLIKFYNAIKIIEQKTIRKLQQKFYHWFTKEEYDDKNMSLEEYNHLFNSCFRCGRVVNERVVPYIRCGLTSNSVIYGYSYDTKLSFNEITANNDAVCILKIEGLEVSKTHFNLVFNVVQMKLLPIRKIKKEEYPEIKLNGPSFVNDSSSDEDDSPVVYDTDIETRQLI